MAFSRHILLAGLRDSYDAAVFRRGRQYFEDEWVGPLAVSRFTNGRIKVTAEVYGTDDYRTTITVDLDTGDVVSSDCSCPYGSHCKHGAAVGLKFIEEGEELLANVAPTADVIAKLKQAGFDVSAIPDSVLQTLAENRQQALPKPVRLPPPRMRTVTDDYFFLLSTGYGYGYPYLQFLSRDRYAGRGYYADLAGRALANGSDLTAEQTKLLKTVKVGRHNGPHADLPELLQQIRQSGFALEVGTETRHVPAVFDLEPKPLDLVLTSDHGYLDFYAKILNPKTLGFTLATAAPLEGSFVGGAGGFVHLVGATLHCYASSALVAGVMARLTERTQDLYDERGRYRAPKKDLHLPYETKLNESEIIRLNDLADGLKAVAKLATDLPLPLDIRAHGKPKACFAVDYDAAKSHLDLTAAMDYEFNEVIITSRMAMKFGSVEKKFKLDDSRYHWRYADGVLDYAPYDDAAEKQFFAAVTNHARLGMHKRKSLTWNGPAAIAQYMAEVHPLFAASGYPLKFVRDRLDFTPAAFRADFNVRFDAGSDLLAFDAACYCGEDRVTVDDLRRFVDEGEQYLRADGGRLLQITNRSELAKFVRMLESFSRKQDGEYEGHAYNVPELTDALDSPHYRAQIAASLKSFLAEAQAGKPVEPVAAPPAVAAVLRDYQKDGLDWCHFLRKYRFGGVLADDMGLGKTLQALCLVVMTRVPGRPSLVVCPKTLVLNWDDEVKKFFPELKVAIIDGPQAERRARLAAADDADLVITSYPCLQRDAALHDARRYNYCLIDEAQFIKNHATQSARAVKAVHADYRLALTGTPLENSVSELWSIFDFLMPGFLGRRADFKRRFETPIMKKGDAAALDELRHKVACFMLRRTKGEVLKELPPKIEQYCHAELGDQQSLLYQEILAAVRREVFDAVEMRGFAKSQIHVLAGLTKLRQVCNHPNLLLKENNYDKYESAKLETFLELIDEIVAAKRQVLVFSQFTTMLDILADELDKRAVSHLYLSGETKNRKELVDRFNSDPANSVFLISLKAGGVGLNLTSADNVIIFDPWWNPSVENQAVDRAHRIGQRHSVNVYRLITKGTIEEKIVKLQDRKRHLFDSLVGESQDLFEKLTWDEVKELFR